VSKNAYFERLGAWAPYSLPTKAPDNPLSETDTYYACFPVGFLPYLLGVAKTLVMPQSWEPYVAGEEDGWAQDAQKLLYALAEAKPGCPDIPTGSWSADYDFTYSEYGFELWPDNDGEWGEYVANEGWKATVGWDSTLQKYVKRLRIKREYVVSAYCTSLGWLLDHVIELQSGGWGSRMVIADLIYNAYIRVELAAHHGSDAYSTWQWGGMNNPTYCNVFTFHAESGWEDSEELLDTAACTLKELVVYGAGQLSEYWL
jgi:hypothetical protein